MVGDVATEKALLNTLDFFERLGVPCWLDGGWGVDVLTGRQNREHRDIDIDFDAAHTKRVISELEAAGYVTVVDWMPSRMELHHDQHGYLDIHPINFNVDGSITQADPNGGEYTFQKEWFSSALYKGRQIPCISGEAQMLFHSGYELTDKDYFDIENLKSIRQPTQTCEDAQVNVPDPDQLNPTTRTDLANVVFLKNEVTSEFIEVGDYTYADSEGDPTPFEQRCVKYLYGPQKLRIGKFTTIAPGVQILMPGGNHPMVGSSTYPFTMFGGDWADATLATFMAIEQPGDTVIGNDVWIGRDAMILPGVSIGDGAVIGARSVVTRDVGPYEVVAGNPAKHIRTRFSDDEIALLKEVAWWDWPLDKITRNAAVIMGGTPAALAACQ